MIAQSSRIPPKEMDWNNVTVGELWEALREVGSGFDGLTPLIPTGILP